MAMLLFFILDILKIPTKLKYYKLIEIFITITLFHNTQNSV